MVKLTLRIIILGALLVFAAFKTRDWLMSEEARIKKRLNTLEQVVSKKSGDQGTELLVKTQRLPKLLHDPCLLEMHEFDIATELTPRQAVAQLARAHSQLDELTIRFLDVNVEVTNATATIHCTVSAKANRGGRTEGDAAEIVCEARKSPDDGKWRFASFKQIDVLRK